MELDEDRANAIVGLQPAEMNPAYAELTRWQLSSEDILVWLEHDLRGEVLDEETKTWQRRGLQLLNEDGIRAIASIVRMKVNKIIFLSKLKEEVINEMTYECSVDIIYLLFMNYEKFNIQKEYLHVILDKVVDIVYVSLMRAEGEGERIFIGKMHRTIEKTQIMQPEQRRGLLGLLGLGNR